MNKTEEILKLIALKDRLEKKIIEMLPVENDTCHCKQHDTIDIIHYGNLFKEILTYCVQCGGICE